MISIIVPIYNVEKYLEPCVNSILDSTYRDFELILVDDGSTDDSGDICDQFAKQDERVRVIHKKNSGVSSSRNEGLKAAKGDFILFVDGDDRVHCQMIETLKTAIDDGDYDFSMVYGVKVDERAFEDLQGSRGGTIDVDEKDIVQLSDTTFFNGLCGLNFQYEVVWNKLYKRSLIGDMQFEHLISESEDTEWNMRVCQRMKSAIVVPIELYYYIKRDGSITSRGINRKTAERIRTFKRCLDDIPKEKREFRDKMLKMLYAKMVLIRRACKNTEYQETADAICREVYQDTVKELLHSNNGLLSKTRSIVGYHFPGLYFLITDALDAKARKSSTAN